MVKAPIVVDIKADAVIVRDKAVLRRLIKVSEEIEGLCDGGREKREDILCHTEITVFGL